MTVIDAGNFEVLKLYLGPFCRIVMPGRNLQYRVAWAFASV